MKKVLFVALLGLVMVAFSACKNKGAAAAEDVVAAAKAYKEAGTDEGKKKEAVEAANKAFETVATLEGDDAKAYTDAMTEAMKDADTKAAYTALIADTNVKPKDPKAAEGENAQPAAQPEAQPAAQPAAQTETQPTNADNTQAPAAPEAPAAPADQK